MPKVTGITQDNIESLTEAIQDLSESVKDLGARIEDLEATQVFVNELSRSVDYLSGQMRLFNFPTADKANSIIKKKVK